MGLFNFFTQEIAMDLGTANTLIIHNDEVVVNEPSIIALNRNNIRFINHYFIIMNNKGIGSTQIHGNLLCKEVKQSHCI